MFFVLFEKVVFGVDETIFFFESALHVRRAARAGRAWRHSPKRNFA